MKSRLFPPTPSAGSHVDSLCPPCGRHSAAYLRSGSPRILPISILLSVRKVFSIAHRPLPKGISEILAHEAFWQIGATSLEPDKNPLDSIQDMATSPAGDRFAEAGIRPPGANFTLDFVKMADLSQYPRGPLFGFTLHGAFVEHPSRVPPARCRRTCGVSATGSERNRIRSFQRSSRGINFSSHSKVRAGCQ